MKRLFFASLFLFLAVPVGAQQTQVPAATDDTVQFELRGHKITITISPSLAAPATAVQDKPEPRLKHKRPRGAKPTAHFDLVRAPKFKKVSAPASFGIVPQKLSYWGNDVDGDCVSTMLACAIAVYSIQQGYPETFIPSATLTSWASKHGYLQGATITAPMTTLQTDGLIATDGKSYTGGPYQSVDYTDYATLCSAISQGPVALGVDGDPLENLVGTSNGAYIANVTGGQQDHCITACGYGTAAQCYAFLAMPLPAGANSQQCIMFETWNTIDVMDFATGLLQLTGEAWLRTPTTPQQATSNPVTPTPTPPAPSPSPGPVPTPSPVSPTPSPAPSPGPVPTPQPSPSPAPTPSPSPPQPVGPQPSPVPSITINSKTRVETGEGQIIIDPTKKELAYPRGWKALEIHAPQANAVTIDIDVQLVQSQPAPSSQVPLPAIATQTTYTGRSPLLPLPTWPVQPLWVPLLGVPGF